MVYNKEDLAYLAGFLDGEGTISLCKQGTRIHYVPQVYVMNTNKEVIDWIHKTFRTDGYVYMKKSNPKKNQKAIYFYYFSRKSMGKLLKELLPYLIVKKKCCKLMLKFLKRKNWGQGMKIPIEKWEIDIVRKLRILNKKGIRNVSV